MNIYNTYLTHIQACLGTDGVTFSSDLDTIARVLFPKHWLGVFARDEIPAHIQRGYMIVNLDNSNQPGSHWVAVANDMFYDSFGRNSNVQLGFTQRYTNTESDAEQDVEEMNCGARCLAWLCVYHSSGPNVAQTI